MTNRQYCKLFELNSTPQNFKSVNTVSPIFDPHGSIQSHHSHKEREEVVNWRFDIIRQIDRIFQIEALQS